MNRRNFLGLFSAGVAGIALEQAIPLGRVWSFPKKIVIPEITAPRFFGIDFGWDEYESAVLTEVSRKCVIGTTIRIRMPQRFIVRDYIGDFTQPKKWQEFTVAGVNQLIPALPPEPRRSSS